MRLSLGITTALPIDQAINIVRLSEENNYYRVWVGEELQGPDIFTYVSILASNTKLRLDGPEVWTFLTKNC